MTTFNKEKHWETIYNTKALTEVSWYQETPETSLQLIKDLQLSNTASIIDIGGGDSFLVDHLITLGYQNITVLDISAAAIKRAKERLGEDAKKITWIVADAAKFTPNETYDLWHDRAAFHFLTEQKDIDTYKRTAENNINTNGHLIVGTFSTNGPTKCSGLDIMQYDEASLEITFQPKFVKQKSFKSTHNTPFNTSQEFTFCTFKKE